MSNKEFNELQKIVRNKNNDHVSIESAMFEDWENKYEDHHLNERYRLFCFKTHKRISLTLIQNTYSPERIDRIIKRVIFCLE